MRSRVEHEGILKTSIRKKVLSTKKPVIVTEFGGCDPATISCRWKVHFNGVGERAVGRSERKAIMTVVAIVAVVAIVMVAVASVATLAVVTTVNAARARHRRGQAHGVVKAEKRC